MDKRCPALWLRTWFGGPAPSADVVAAGAALDCRAVSRVRRQVSRGRALEDATQARLAVALAREQQVRRTAVPEAVVLLAVLAGACWLLIESARAPHGAPGVIVVAALLLLIFRGIWGDVAARTTMPRAERENLRVLDEAGTSFVESKRARPPVPLAAQFTAVLTSLVLFDFGFGAGTLALEGGSRSLAGVIRHGALFAIAMTIFNLVQREKRDARQRSVHL